MRHRQDIRDWTPLDFVKMGGGVMIRGVMIRGAMIRGLTEKLPKAVEPARPRLDSRVT